MIRFLTAALCMLSIFPARAYASEDELVYLREEVETVESVSKYAQSLKDVPADVTIITSDEIEKYGYRDISDILNAIPGFYMTYDRTMSNIGIRGFGRPGDYNSRVLLLVDGHPVNDDIYGTADINLSGPVDVDLISKVEVIKGPGYLYFGNNAVFAVINIVTKRPLEVDGLMLSTEAGSLSTYKGVATYGGTISDYDTVLHASYMDSKGKERIYFSEQEQTGSNNGIVEDSDKSWHKTFYTKIKKDGFQIQGMFREYDKYVPTATNLTVFNDKTQHWNPNYSFIELSYKGILGNSLDYTVRGFYNSFEEKFYYPYNDADGYWMWLDHQISYHYGAEARVDWRINDRNRVLIGTEVRTTHAELHATDTTNIRTFVDANKPYSSYSLFGQYEIRPSNNLISYLGLRYDDYGNLYNGFRSVLLPYAAIVYSHSDTGRFKLSYSEAYRTPSVFEAFYITNTADGPYGNADLNIERWHLVNGMYEKALSDRADLSLGLFRYWISDLIDSSTTALGGVMYDNVASDTEGTGGEAGISLRGDGGKRGNLSYSYQFFRDKINGQLLNSPLHIAKGRFSFPVYSRLFLGVEGLYISERKKSDSEWVSAHGKVNTTLSARNIYKNLDLSLGIYNLLDENYSDPGSSDTFPITSIEQNGRTFRLKASYTF